MDLKIDFFKFDFLIAAGLNFIRFYGISGWMKTHVIQNCLPLLHYWNFLEFNIILELTAFHSFSLSYLHEFPFVNSHEKKMGKK